MMRAGATLLMTLSLAEGGAIPDVHQRTARRLCADTCVAGQNCVTLPILGTQCTNHFGSNGVCEEGQSPGGVYCPSGFDCTDCASAPDPSPSLPSPSPSSSSSPPPSPSSPLSLSSSPSPPPPPSPSPPPPQPPPCSPFTMSANQAVSGSSMQIGESSNFYYADRCECEVACAGESGCLGFVDNRDDKYCKFKTSTVTYSNTNKDFWARDSSCTTPPTCTLPPPSLPPPSSLASEDPSPSPSPSPPPDPPSPPSPRSSPPFPPPPSPSSSKLTISFTAAGTVTDFPKDSVRDAFAAEANVAASQVLVTVTAGSVVVAVEIAADAYLAPAAAAAWADDLNTALAPSLSDASSLDSFLASKGVTSVTTESTPTVVVVKPSPMSPPSLSPSLPPPSAVPTNATQLGVIEWTDHRAFWAAGLVMALIIVACGVCACCSPYSPCFDRAARQSKAGETPGGNCKGNWEKVYESLPEAWKNKENQKELCTDTKFYFQLVKDPEQDAQLDKDPKKDGRIVDDKNEPINEDAANQLLRGVELHHVLNSSDDGSPLSMKMGNKEMFNLSSPQTQLFAFLSHVMNPDEPKPKGDGKIETRTLKRKVRTLQVHVKLPMLVAGFILINGLAAISGLLHPLWIAIPFYLVAFLILNYAVNRSTNVNLLKLLGYSGPQFYCNTACVRQSYNGVGKEPESPTVHACFCAGLSLFEYTLSRTQQLWVLYSANKKHPHRDYLSRPWCVYELAMYVKTKLNAKEAVEIEVISLSTQLGMKLTRFIQLCMIASVVIFLHMFAGGVAFYTPFDPETMTLDEWKADQAAKVFNFMPDGSYTATYAASTVGGPVTFLFVVCACIFMATLRTEREEILERLKNFEWERVRTLIKTNDEKCEKDLEEVEERIIKRYKKPNEEETNGQVIANFNKAVQTMVHDEFEKSLVKREGQTLKMLFILWFTSGFIIGGMALYAIDLARPVVSPEDIPTQRLENHGLWSALYFLSIPLIFCISCGAIISLATAGACANAKVAPEQ